jgi:cardiolipin synthase A/B
VAFRPAIISLDPRRSSRFAAFILGMTLLAGLAGCALPPDVDAVDSHTAHGSASPRLSGVRGPLTEKQSRAILDRLRRDNPSSDILQRHLAFEEAIAAHPLTIGNKTTLLRDGEATFAAMFKAMAAAKHHINLEYYIFEDVEQDGKHLADLLIAKQKTGVQVNLIYDSQGSGKTPSEVFDRLKQAGVHTLEFRPLNPFSANKSYSINDRNHRKILVVDGTLAVVGGINMSTVYASSGLGSGRGVPASDEKGGAQVPPDDNSTTPAKDRWRDTDLQIEGPAVAELQQLFVQHWHEETDEPLSDRGFYPAIKDVGNQIVRIVGSTPADSIPQFYVTLVSAIRSAETRIWLSAAYFIPTHQEREALEDAARRGVDVRLLLPKRNDSALALDAGRSNYTDLLESGVKIYELRDAILHSKTAVIDGVWSAVGSSNFDGRSVLFNDEVDAVVVGRETAAQLETSFERDLQDSDRVDLSAWKDRPIGQKLRELLSRVTAYWL